MKRNGRWPLVALIVGMVVVTTIRVRLLDLPLERDEGGYAYFGQLILDGVPPFAGAYDTKLPGIYYIYAAAMAVFGQTEAGIRAGLLLANLLTVAFVFLLCGRVAGRSAGGFAALSFGILSLSPWVQGPWAHLEHYLAAAVAAGLLLVLDGQARGRRDEIFLGGLCLGLALVIKHPAVAFVLIGCACLVLNWPVENAGVRIAAVARLGVFSAGVLVPPVLMLIHLVTAGVWESFLIWAFEYPAHHVSTNSLEVGLLLLRQRAGRIVLANPVIAGLGLVGLLPPLWLANWRKVWGFLWLFCLFSLVAVSPGLFFRPHYFILLLPAAAVAAGLGFDGVARISNSLFGRWPPRLLVGALLLGAFLLPLYKDAPFFFAMDSFEASRMVYQSNPFPESVTIGSFIREKTAPEDRIAILGSEPQIYVYANRRSVTPYIFTYALMEVHPWALHMQQDMIRSIEQGKPAYLVSVNMASSWLPRQGSQGLLFHWARSYVSRHYEQVGLVQIPTRGEPRFLWGGDVSRLPSRTPASYEFRRPSISIFRRKEPSPSGGTVD